MLRVDEKTKRFAVNSIFPSLLYAILGLVFAQLGTAQMQGSWGLHVFVGVPGLTLSGLALYRARLHWPAPGTGMSSPGPRALGWYLLLLAAGAGIGVLASAGSVLLLAMVAALTYLLPWTRIPVCHARFAMSLVAILAGAVAGVVAFGIPVHPLYLMIAAWMLFIPPMFMHFLVMASLDSRYRINEPRFSREHARA
jgi:hypothetical protein